nr:uncharacterized protein LOC109429856 isoform X1 [Aedes albopictus]
MDGNHHTREHSTTDKEQSNWDGFCRLCFSDQYPMAMVCLFPKIANPNWDLMWKILECTTLKLTYDKDSTAQICKACIEKMDEFCNYRMQCLKNDKWIESQRQRTNNIQKHDAVQNTVEVLQKPSEQSEDTNRDAYNEEEYEEISVIHEETIDEEAEQADDESNADDSIVRQALTIYNVKKESSFDDDELINVADNSDPPDASETSDTDQPKDQPEKVIKKRTRKILLYDGHTYQLLSSRPKCGTITWGCIWRKTKDCRGTLGTKANGLILGNVIPQHNHLPQPVDESKQRKSIVIRAFREVENIFLNEPYKITKNRIGGDMLVFNGDRYPYSHSRKDGCRIWKCASHRKCTVSIYLCPDGRIFKLANSRHSEEKILQKRSYSSASETDVHDISANIEEIYPNPKGDLDYTIVKNANKRNVLLYEGDQYIYYYTKTNGWVVWRCTVWRCLALLYQLCDGSVTTLHDNVPHNHAGKVAKCP